MQLNLGKPRIGIALCVLTANLLAATGAAAQDDGGSGSGQANDDGSPVTNVYDEPADDLGSTTLDGSVLYYHEDGGRVTAIEPVVSFVHTYLSGDILSARVTFDTLSGASPNGAAPWSAAQTFVTPIDDTDSATGASGTVILNPVTGKYERHYTTAPNTLPVDPAFRDGRIAVDFGYSTAVGSDMKLNVGVNGSKSRTSLRSQAASVSRKS